MNLKTLNILFADDDADDRFFFEKALKEIPIDTHLVTVDDGEHLMNYLNNLVGEEKFQPLPDILFLDLSMPRKNGLECLVEIKKDEKLKELCIVMFSTSYPRDLKYEEIMIKLLSDIGVHEYIRKPGDYEQFKTIIHQVIIRVIEKCSIDVQAIHKEILIQK